MITALHEHKMTVMLASDAKWLLLVAVVTPLSG